MAPDQADPDPGSPAAPHSSGEADGGAATRVARGNSNGARRVAGGESVRSVWSRNPLNRGDVCLSRKCQS
jgi:hypothetical protein